jgi:hypothetical protein
MISFPVFVGIGLLEAGLALFIGSFHVYGFRTDNSFEIMFGVLLLAHGLLKRGSPYRIGKIGVFLGIVFLGAGIADYYGSADLGWAILFVLLGLVVILTAVSRRWL